MIRIAVCLFALFAFAAPAQAHPHVWVTMQSEIVYAPDGSVTGVRHAWTFDESFSSFATQDLETKTKGVFTREDLAPLAEVNVASLKEYEYFTQAKADSAKIGFAEPKDYWLDYANSRLTLHFLLPLMQPAKAKVLKLEIYDAAYFIDFSFAEGQPVTLAGASAGCSPAISKPAEAKLADAKRLSESFFDEHAADEKFGAQFANTVTVTCR